MTQEPVYVDAEQVQQLRDACYSERFQQWSRARNDAMIGLFADTGLRVGELVQLRTAMFTDDFTDLLLPGDVQKSYQENSPGLVRMEIGKLETDMPRTLKQYLDTRWKDSEFLFPSKKKEDMSPQGVRKVIKSIAREAEIKPYRPDGSRADPGDLHPHAFRHSIAHRMLTYDNDFSIDDVSRRLRHKRRATTEDTYSHFRRV
jgi:integrase/recombinase XerC/integrase/recombinase XerD